MAGAYIRGVGLSCALGMDAEQCVSAMLAGQVAPVALELDGFAEPPTLHYYRIPDRAELFDARRFAQLLPPVAQAAVTQAGLSAAEIRALPVFVGSSCFSVGLAETEYQLALARDTSGAVPMPVCDYGYPARLVQQALGCEGATWAYNTACTSSGNALLGALRMLRSGAHRHALVVGAELANRTTLAGFSGLQVLTDVARPFDAKRRGMLLGEGVGAVVLSLEAGDEADIRLLGGASNCDTHSVPAANPDGRSTAAVFRQALAAAKLQADAIRGIKAHGTASTSGDQAEAAGLQQVFTSVPPLSALKPYLGHTLGACGVTELVLYTGALRHGLLPATPGFKSADPGSSVRPLTRIALAPQGHYLLNYFGFGGNNTVLVLEKSA